RRTRDGGPARKQCEAVPGLVGCHGVSFRELTLLVTMRYLNVHLTD
ncbi:hypothetical protein HZU72_22590, partial [Halomonas sp. QX-2]|nr:hypothetical protein [Halomonas sedimenti]